MPDATALTLDSLADAVRASWDRATTADPEHWSADLAALGQCAVSALVVQDCLGWDLLRATVGGVSHYWNRLPDGSEVDLAREQFTTWTPEGMLVRERDYVLSFPVTASRYEVLASRVRERLTR